MGIKLDECTPAGNARANLYNNMVYINHASAFVYGIYCFYTERTNIFQNTTKVSGPNVESAAFLLNESFQDSVFNNLFTSFGNGMTFYVGATDQTVVNFNGYYHSGPVLGTFEFGSYVLDNLQEWTALTGFDSNSVIYPPYFISGSNLHLGNSYFNGKGSPALSSIYDIDGEMRDITNPDPGADEFDPESLDASIASLLSPIASCDTFQNVEVVLINLGTDTITSAVVQWTLNGNAQPQVSFSGTLLPEGDTAHVILQTLALFDDQADTLIFRAESLNGNADMFVANDTLKEFYSLPLSGAYTIGGVSPDFATINSAMAALKITHCGGSFYCAMGSIPTNHQNIGCICYQYHNYYFESQDSRW
jgi:hypothetical protein